MSSCCCFFWVFFVVVVVVFFFTKGLLHGYFGVEIISILRVAVCITL